MIKRVFLVTVCAAFLLNFLTGCYDSREIDDWAYVIAIGMDKGKTHALKITLKFAVPKNIGGAESKGQGGGGGDGSTTDITLESPTLFSGLNMANNIISRQINLFHAKVIVFSKELAEDEIFERMITAFPRTINVRPEVFILVARDSAEEYVKGIQLQFEVNPTKFYELAYTTSHYTGFIAPITLRDFILRLKSYDRQPVGILAGVSRYKSSEDFDPQRTTNLEKGRAFPLEGDYFAGDIPKVSENKTEVMGLAVFDGARMVGELDGAETGLYLMVTGEFRSAYMTHPDPLVENSYVILNVNQGRKPVHSVKMSDGKPEISVKIMLEADIQVIQSGKNYESLEMKPLLQRTYEKFLEEGITRFLYKTSEEFHSDICGFGKSLKKRFLTWKEWEEFNWLSRYKDASFSVEVELKIRRPGLIIRTVPIKSSEE